MTQNEHPNDPINDEFNALVAGQEGMDAQLQRTEIIFHDLCDKLDPELNLDEDPDTQLDLARIAQHLAKNEASESPEERLAADRSVLIEMFAGGAQEHLINTVMTTRNLSPLTLEEKQQAAALADVMKAENERFLAMQDEMGGMLQELGINPSENDFPYLDTLAEYAMAIRYQTPSEDQARVRANCREWSAAHLPAELKPLAMRLFAD